MGRNVRSRSFGEREELSIRTVNLKLETAAVAKHCERAMVWAAEITEIYQLAVASCRYVRRIRAVCIT